MFQARRESSARVIQGLDRASARSVVLQYLPHLACRLSILLSSPGRTIGESKLRSLLDELIFLLQLHSPADAIEAALRQLEELCTRAESNSRTIEVVVKNGAEFAETKLGISLLGGVCGAASERLLVRVHRLAASGGTVRKLAAEALWLSALLAKNGEVVPFERESRIPFEALPVLSDIDVERVRKQSEKLLKARRQLRQEGILAFPRLSRGIRNPARDSARTSLLAIVHGARPVEERIAALSKLSGDTHPETIHKLLSLALSKYEELELREVAVCILEEVIGDLPLDEGEAARNAVLTAILEINGASDVSAADLFLPLRLLVCLAPSLGSANVSSLLVDPVLRKALRSSPLEGAILILLITVSGTTDLSELLPILRGEGLEHLPSDIAAQVRVKAAQALGSSNTYNPELLHLLLENDSVDFNDCALYAVAESLSARDDEKKTSVIVRLLKGLADGRAKGSPGHFARLARAIRRTKSLEAHWVLMNLASNSSIPAAVRRECAASLGCMHESGFQDLQTLLENSPVEVRMCLLSAAADADSATKLAVLVRRLAEPLEFSDGVAGVEEKAMIVSSLTAQGVL